MNNIITLINRMSSGHAQEALYFYFVFSYRICQSVSGSLPLLAHEIGNRQQTVCPSSFVDINFPSVKNIYYFTNNNMKRLDLGSSGVITQRVVISYRCFRTTNSTNLHGSRILELSNPEDGDKQVVPKGITASRCVINQQSAILLNVAAEA